MRDPERLNQLVRDYQQNPDLRQRNWLMADIIKEVFPLAKKLARQYPQLESEDATQVTLVELVKACRAYEGKGRFSELFLIYARNGLTNERAVIRAKKRTGALVSLDADKNGTTRMETVVDVHATDPAEMAMVHDLEEQLFRRISPVQKEAYQKYKVYLTCGRNDFAGPMGIEEGNVQQTRLMKCRVREVKLAARKLVAYACRTDEFGGEGRFSRYG